MAQPAAATPATSRATAVARAYIDRMPPRDSGIGIGNKKTPGMPRVERVTSRGCERFPIPIPLALNWFCQPIDRQISGNLYVRLIPLFRPNVDGRRIGHVRRLPVAPACRPGHRLQAALVGRASGWVAVHRSTRSGLRGPGLALRFGLAALQKVVAAKRATARDRHGAARDAARGTGGVRPLRAGAQAVQRERNGERERRTASGDGGRTAGRATGDGQKREPRDSARAEHPGYFPATRLTDASLAGLELMARACVTRGAESTLWMDLPLANSRLPPDFLFGDRSMPPSILAIPCNRPRRSRDELAFVDSEEVRNRPNDWRDDRRRVGGCSWCAERHRRIVCRRDQQPR